MGDAERQLRKLGIKELLAIAILAAQVLGIGLGRVTHESFWSWIPHDCVLVYDMEVTLGDRELTSTEIRQRYGIQPKGRRSDYPEDLTAIVRLREKRRPEDQSRVVVRYSVNRGDTEVWHWPQR